MTEEKNLIPGREESLIIIIEAAKKYKSDYNHLTLLEALKGTLHGWYDYSKRWHEKMYDEEFYKYDKCMDYIYRFTETKITPLPEIIRYYLADYYQGNKFPETLDTAAHKKLKEDIEAMLNAEYLKKRKLQKTLNETEEIRRILSCHNYTLALECVLPFIELEEAGKLRGNGTKSETMLIADMFNLGFILGKRTERSRKHKHTT